MSQPPTMSDHVNARSDRQDRIEKIRSRFRAARAARETVGGESAVQRNDSHPPRYDAVFFEGTAWLDTL
jgi:hypothetical protein